MNFIIHHPMTGVQVEVNDGEDVEEAVDRYNRDVLGYEPEGEQKFPIDPVGPHIYSEKELGEMQAQGVTDVVDPDTNKQVKVGKYIEKYYGEWYRG